MLSRIFRRSDSSKNPVPESQSKHPSTPPTDKISDPYASLSLPLPPVFSKQNGRAGYTVEALKALLEEAKQLGATHAIFAKDSQWYRYYVLPVLPNQEAKSVAKWLTQLPFQSVSAVYSLGGDISLNEQLGKWKVMNWDSSP